MFGIRGVDIHSQLRMIFIIATHQLNTRTTNPTPIPTYPTPSSILPLPFTYRPIVLYRSLIIVLSSYPSPYFSQYYSHTPYTPILPYISPKKHTPFKISLFPKRVFLKLPIDKYLKIAYNKLIKGGR